MTTNKKSNLKLGKQDEPSIISLLNKIDNQQRHNEAMNTVRREELYELLSSAEIEVIERVFALDPASYGLKNPYFGIEEMPVDLVRMEAQPYHCGGKECITTIQYIPGPVHVAFSAMAQAMQADLGRPLLITSSYRSSTYQAIVFLFVLYSLNYDVSKTVSRVAIPGYSEHSTTDSLALDLQNIDGLPSDDNPTDFETTPEFSWLLKHANEFNFFLSYPKNNPYGIMFEPWHWRHIPQS